MEKDEVQMKLTSIFRDTFVNDNLQIGETTTAQDVPEWDSLAHINLIMAVEKGFGISLTTREIRAMKNVGDFINLIQKKIA